MLGRSASYRKKFFISATKTTPAPRSSIHTDALMYIRPRIISKVEMRSKMAGTVSGRNWRRLLSLACSWVIWCSSAVLPRAERRRRASDIRWMGSAKDIERNMIHVWKRLGRNGSSSPDNPIASVWKSILDRTVQVVPAMSPTRKTAVDQTPHASGSSSSMAATSAFAEADPSKKDDTPELKTSRNTTHRGRLRASVKLMQPLQQIFEPRRLG
eukprot:scaffold19113_cov98-Isochrysis_galbana.AAC.4